MSDGTLEKMDKDFSPQVDALLPETEALTKVKFQSSNASFINRNIFVARKDK